jgi:hypothetical protein
MKILIITNLAPYYKTDINICNIQDRFDMLAYYIYNELVNKNIIVYLKPPCSIKIKNNISEESCQKLKYPIVDHTVLVLENGFKNRPYINYIKSITHGLIYTLTNTTKCYLSEDKLINILPSLYRINTYPFNYLISPASYNQKQTFDIIKILIDNTYMGPLSYIMDKDITPYVNNNCDEFINRNVGIDIEIIQTINSHEYKSNYNNIRFNKYGELLEYYSTINLFFVTNLNYDPLKLVDLAASNVMIIAPLGYVSSDLIKLLSIFEYDPTDSIPWSNIFSVLHSFNSYDNIIKNGNTIHKLIDQLIIDFTPISLTHDTSHASHMIKNIPDNQNISKTKSKTKDKLDETILNELFKPVEFDFSKYNILHVNLPTPDKPNEINENAQIKPVMKLLKRPKILLQTNNF